MLLGWNWTLEMLSIVIYDCLGDQWFGMLPILTNQGVNSWVKFTSWCKNREVDCLIVFRQEAHVGAMMAWSLPWLQNV